MSPLTGAASNSAWYSASREEFLKAVPSEVAKQLSSRAIEENLDVQPEQAEEWTASVSVLQSNLETQLPVLREALTYPGNETIRSVILEYDFRRRGLRIDCLLLADGVLFVLEFKRSAAGKADRDQVTNYAVNLIEFHSAVQDWSADQAGAVVPVLVTTGSDGASPQWPGFRVGPWSSLTTRPLTCGKSTLGLALSLGLEHRRTTDCLEAPKFLNAAFQPSSTIIDAAISLFGNHDVSAIKEHAASVSAINNTVVDVRKHIAEAMANKRRHIVFVSGAPGAGKTLVGLDIVMRGDWAENAAFITGNAPLVEVLNKALATSYKKQGASSTAWVATGYAREDAKLVSAAATYKIVKAHNFLGDRGKPHKQFDGRVLVFDEAQRTYRKGRMVLRKPLEDHEADLILQTQQEAYGENGTAIVALIGHNQAINDGEMGIEAWLKAAERLNWTFSISDETLALGELKSANHWATHTLRSVLAHGHLQQSMRFYRNAAVEIWADAVLGNRPSAALTAAQALKREGLPIYITRSLETARSWAREIIGGGERSGIVASSQGRRLAAEGLHVNTKPDIGDWMLAPHGDIRSSSMLETVQNQFQVQGLEIDYSIVAWDLDLRRVANDWKAYRIAGSSWNQRSDAHVIANGYRVLLTRARKGMMIFVPAGDPSEIDETRPRSAYDAIADFLLVCGAVNLSSS